MEKAVGGVARQSDPFFHFFIDVTHSCSVNTPCVLSVIPAKAGIQYPACEWRTSDRIALRFQTWGGGRAVPKLAQYAYWIPAFAGMTLDTDIFVERYALAHDDKASLKRRFR